MSIWATRFCADADEHEQDCAVWVPIPAGTPFNAHGHQMIGDGGRWRYDDTIPCTCRCGPIRFQGSHILPADTDGRAGVFAVNEIPSHITRDGRDDRPEDGAPWPWLNFWSGNGGDSVLDRGQVAELHAYLDEWLGRTEPTP